ncbi:transglycosylase domain-containing protein [Uliginosibacterium sp. sgz301328]|uniref:transglycosylase domain-containing protein n=1 Tax=Uliginosibacterium sp. sgz301328 TaxID=3243764 RepID=UPI00359DF17C
MKSVRVLCVAFVIAVANAPAFAQLPSFEQVRNGFVGSDATLLDRKGTPLSDVRLDFTVRRLPWTPLTALSPAMREALLAAEDKRFFEHPGVDWRAFIGAAWQNLWSHTQRGGSTLTMQVAGLLEPELRLPSRGRRSYTQKWDQSLAAIELERHWTKAQILEAYLNLAPLRGDLQGLAAGSAFLFGMDTHQLTRPEAVILAALLRGPNAKPEIVARRACALARNLGSPQMCSDIARLAQQRLDAPRGQPRYALAPHLARQLLKQPGQTLTSTLDADMQRHVLDIVRDSNAPDAAVLVLDNVSNEALVWVGAPNGSLPDGVSTRRTLPQWWWPHAATLALDTRRATAATVFGNPPPGTPPDSQIPFDTASLRTALAQHRPGPMGALLHQLPPSALAERLHLVGLEPPLAADAPDANGDVTLSQAATAWRALATGNSGPVHVQQAGAEGLRVLSTAASFIVLDMLSSNDGGWRAQWVSQSPDSRQAMVVGSSDRYTVAVAVGSGNEHADRIAEQVWRQSMIAVQPQPSRPPQPPEGVSSDIVLFDPPIEAPRREWFIRGSEGASSSSSSERYRKF